MSLWKLMNASRNEDIYKVKRTVSFLGLAAR